MQTAWLTSATNTVVPDDSGGSFGPDAAPVCVSIDAGTGTVVIQGQDSAGTWFALTDGTFNADTVVLVDTRNLFALRVIATGDAKYRVNWVS